jgi:hypothetical protein
MRFLPPWLVRVAFAVLSVTFLAALAPGADDPPADASAKPTAQLRAFLDSHCVRCHDSVSKKGGLDLETTEFEPDDPRNFPRWVKILDRASAGEMPPRKSPKPEPKELASFSITLSSALLAANRERVARDGRASRRRLNRLEYENVLRDLLSAPWLEIKEKLPEDGVAHRFNKVGEALDVSHVQMARYLIAADYALREAMANQVDRPGSKTVRYYARDQPNFTGKFKYSVFNSAPERAMFPTLGSAAQPGVRAGKEPLTVGASDPERRELEGVGLVCSSYEPIEPKFNKFRAPMTGHYRLRFNAHSVWVGPNGSNAVGAVANAGPKRWFIPNFDEISAGRRSEPVTIYSEAPPHQLRRIGSFDIKPEAGVHELDAWLLAGETIRPDAARLFRSRPPRRTASQALPTDGWRSKGRTSTSGRRSGIGSSSATCRSRIPRTPRDALKSSRKSRNRTRKPCCPRSPGVPIAGRLMRLRPCGSFPSSTAD